MRVEVNLDEKLARLSRSGVEYVIANDSSCRYIIELARARGVKSVVKAKSMTTPS